MNCNVWREHAENVTNSLTKGARVLVTGKLKQRSYTTKEGQERQVVELEVEDVGFCFDTCHGWAAGIDLKTAIKELKAITKRIDLIHANGSRDEFDSSRDRHSNFAESLLPQDEIAKVVKDAGCNVIIETAEPGVKDDIKFIT